MVVKIRLAEMGPLHVTPTPQDEVPPEGSNEVNYLRYLVDQFASKLVEDGVIGGNNGRNEKPGANHFGVAEPFIRAKMK